MEKLEIFCAHMVDFRRPGHIFSVLAYGYSYQVFYACLLFKSSFPALVCYHAYLLLVWLPSGLVCYAYIYVVYFVCMSTF